jgi:adenylosuccinate synthase
VARRELSICHEPNEIDWPTLAAEARLKPEYVELTSATNRVRRIGRFDAEVVRRAIAVNKPHRIVLNHLDYVGSGVGNGRVTNTGWNFVASVEGQIERKVNLIGTSPADLVNSVSENTHWKVANVG